MIQIFLRSKGHTNMKFRIQGSRIGRRGGAGVSRRKNAQVGVNY